MLWTCRLGSRESQGERGESGGKSGCHDGAACFERRLTTYTRSKWYLLAMRATSKAAAMAAGFANVKAVGVAGSSRGKGEREAVGGGGGGVLGPGEGTDGAWKLGGADGAAQARRFRALEAGDIIEAWP